MTQGARTEIEEADNPYRLITMLAARASRHTLAWLLGTALAAGAALLLASVRYWPFAALAGTLGMIAIWGLLAHRAEYHASVLLTTAQRLVVALGALLAFGALLAIFFAMLGPRWML